LRPYIYIIQTAVILALVIYVINNESKENPSDPEINNVPNMIDPYVPGPGYQVHTFDLPLELTFAGEKVPLEIPDVKERLDREVHTNIYWHTNTIFMIKRANRWLPQIEKILKDQDLPADFKYLPMIESTLLNQRSPKGAIGFWQILSGTGRELGLEINSEIDERYHPLKSTEAACKYLKKAHERFGNWTNVAASYNVGMRGLQRRIEEQKSDSYYDLLLNQETSRYVFRILAIKVIMENPKKYGYDIPAIHLYEDLPTRHITVEHSIKDLVVWSQEQQINYKILKLHNPWLRKNSLTIKRKGVEYQVSIPENPVVDKSYSDNRDTLHTQGDTSDFQISTVN